MPLVKKCPTCQSRMIRLYERERYQYHGSHSNYYGYAWLCPNGHTVIIDSRKTKTPELLHFTKHG
jgi:hypothetical protein